MTIAIQSPLARLQATWLAHLVVLAGLIAVAAFSFRDAIGAAVGVWSVSPTYSHCFLIIPIVIWLVWEKRQEVAATAPQPMPVLLALLVPLLLVWWAGEILTINEVRQFAIVAMVQVLIVAVLGLAVSRILWFPILYLVFLVPTGEYLIVPMQHFAASFVSLCLTALGIPFFREGTLFELSNGRFQIAEACAGLRFLIATTTLSVLVANMMFVRVYKWVAFLAASIIVPLIANGLRCLGIILLAHFTNNEYGAGADHIVYGWGFNVAILMVMIFLGYLYRDRIAESSPPAAPGSVSFNRARLAMVAAISAILIGVGPALADLRQHQPQPFPALMAGPLSTPDWIDTTDRLWQPSFMGADGTRTLTWTAQDAGIDPVEFYIAYYVSPRTGHTLSAHANVFWNEHWTLVSSRVADVTLAGRPARMQETVLNTPDGVRMVWSVYCVDRQFTIEPLSLKLLQLRAVIDGESGQAAIAFSTPVSGTLEDARHNLAKAIGASGPLIAQLSSAPPTASQPGAL
jgi:exosortase A